MHSWKLIGGGGNCLRYAWLRIKGPFDVMRKGGTALS